MLGSLDYPDLISGSYITLDDDSQVSSGPHGLGEAARKPLVIHPSSESPAGDSWLGNLENRGPDLPPLADERMVELDAFRGEVFTKLTGYKRSTERLFPPPRVLGGVRVDGLVGPPVCLAIRPTAGDFQIALLAGRPPYSNSRTVPTLTERTLPPVVAIRLSRSAPADPRPSPDTADIRGRATGYSHRRTEAW